MCLCVLCLCAYVQVSVLCAYVLMCLCAYLDVHIPPRRKPLSAEGPKLHPDVRLAPVAVVLLPSRQVQCNSNCSYYYYKYYNIDFRGLPLRLRQRLLLQLRQRLRSICSDMHVRNCLMIMWASFCVWFTYVCPLICAWPAPLYADFRNITWIFSFRNGGH